MISSENQPPIFIGLGGIGTRIVSEITEEKGTDIIPFSIDSDIIDIKYGHSNIPNDHIISLSTTLTVLDLINLDESARDWFPMNPLLTTKALREGSGQVRSISRLMFNHAMKSNRFVLLLDEVKSVATECLKTCSKMQICIVTSLVGGTGSGLFLSLASFLRESIEKEYPNLELCITGDFVLPGYFDVPSISEKTNLQANAYAALKELISISNHKNSFGFGFSAIKRPFDFCFLYDKNNC